MTRQEINRVINNLVRDGLTRGEAFVKIRNILIRRLEYSQRGSKMEERFLDDIVLLDKVWMGR